MRKINKFTVLLLTMFLLCLAGCGDSKNDKAPEPTGPLPPPINNTYTVPAGISIGVYDGNTLKTTITTDDLKNKVQQEVVPTVTNQGVNRDYIAYKVSDVLKQLNCTLSAFTMAAYYENSDTPVVRYSSSLDNAYIAIGYLNGTTLDSTNAPRLMPEGAESTSGEILQNFSKLTVNPGAIAATPDPNPNDTTAYTAAAGFAVEVFNGARQIGIINADILAQVEQKRVTTSNNRVYIAYVISDVLAKLRDSGKLSSFTQAVYDTTDIGSVVRYSSNLNNAYIAIGYLASGTGALNTGNTPRLLAEGPYTTSGSVIQNVYQITVNPITEVKNQYTVPATYNSIEVYDGATRKFTITAADLGKVPQKYVRYVGSSSGTPNDRMYVAYAIEDVLDYLGIGLSAFTQVKYDDVPATYTRQYGRTNFARAYIAIGRIDTADWGASLPTQDKLNTNTWIIADSNSSVGGDIVSNAGRITVNP